MNWTSRDYLGFLSEHAREVPSSVPKEILTLVREGKVPPASTWAKYRRPVGVRTPTEKQLEAEIAAAKVRLQSLREKTA